MIVVKLSGGLGNQMFQYAAGRNLAHKNGMELLLDLSSFEPKRPVNYIVRGFTLDVFPIKARLENNFWINKYFRKVRILTKNITEVTECSMAYTPEIMELNGNVYLDGYWQSEKYFSGIRQILLAELQYRPMTVAPVAAYAERITGCNAVSIHIRRGDYVSATLAHTYVDLFETGYYQRALERISNTVEEPVFFVFSDDIKWAAKNLKTPYPHHFIDHGYGQDHLDMYLMSLCRHQIIANSSFSWWAAWLNNNETKTVIAPVKWFNDPSIDTADLVPEVWLRI